MSSVTLMFILPLLHNISASILIQGKEPAILERKTNEKIRTPDLHLLFVYQHFHEGYLVICRYIKTFIFTVCFIKDV